MKKLSIKETLDTGKLRIKGFAINRELILLNDEYPLAGNFDWGIENQKSLNLAGSLINTVFGSVPDKYFHLAKQLQKTIIANLPVGNFDIELDLILLRKFFENELEIPKGKKIHVWQLFKSKIGKEYYPMFIDFVNLPYKDFIFESNTIQYQYLKKLNTEQIKDIKAYIKAVSKHKNSLGDWQVTEVVGFLDFKSNNRKVFLVRNGLGTGEWLGLPTNEYIELDW